VTEASLATGLIYPPQSTIFAASVHVATQVTEHVFDKNLARVPRPKDIAALTHSRIYRPVYVA
jgi:malate dehydrogenase (oxaloacetate-decarboxylating)(NADP+)